MVDSTKSTFGKKKAEAAGIPANLHLLSITRQGNFRGKNLEHMRILVKFRFGRGMRPVNQGFGKILLPKQSNPASVKGKILGWKTGRPLDLGKRMDGIAQTEGIGMNREVQRTGKEARKIHSQIFEKRGLHGQRTLGETGITGFPGGNAMTLGYDCLCGCMEAIAQRIWQSRAKALEEAMTATAWPDTNAYWVHATWAMSDICIPVPVFVDSSIRPATNVVDAQKSPLLTLWRGIRWGGGLPHSELRP